ncbi:PPOX class F420-dependent oxidoreductase [Kribbella kalugense]|uniref:Pyridoxamine 5'-phosphate oxidase family protein n=1 Tax=Kribbella kalugense TaxID=2512221 RepID=A0A4R8A0K1_9ACTN|nr:PPOX class F420-dependent oxidoreductase [Kribbella kalugense]TDW24009.1 pyridoxamine 5'-phosphate oxidase family protein [Kribbella kalugense]
MSFSDDELDYLRSQRIARIATVGTDGQPDAVPVGFEYDGTHLYVGGIDPVKTRKFRNVQAGNTKVAVVLDDLASVDPWVPRYLRIYGEAELVERTGRFGAGTYLRITPTTSWSFNLEGKPFTYDDKVTTTRTVHTSEGVTSR